MSNPARIVLLADFDREYLGGRSFVLGIDEAGRGALAGPCARGRSRFLRGYIPP